MVWVNAKCLRSGNSSLKKCHLWTDSTWMHLQNKTTVLYSDAAAHCYCFCCAKYVNNRKCQRMTIITICVRNSHVVQKTPTTRNWQDRVCMCDTRQRIENISKVLLNIKSNKIHRKSVELSNGSEQSSCYTLKYNGIILRHEHLPKRSIWDFFVEKTRRLKGKI